MAEYERMTAATIREVLRTAEEVLMARLPIEKVGGDRHSITLKGGDGTVTVEAHRHGPDTVVHASTDQLRTSRLDLETQYFLNQLPYQPGDVARGTDDAA
ncbi:MAG TPA: hypothetical protein VF212_15865 [Longimicrobiales bacterium]